MSGQELTTVSERRAALAKQYSDPPAQVSARIPEIRLSVHMSKKDVPKGHFFVVDPNVPQGEDATITDIGTEFQCVVLRSCMKMSAFDSDAQKGLAETTEFSDFQNEPIFVIDNAGERPCLVTVAPYGIIKQMKYEPTKEELKAYRDSGGQAGKTLHPLHPVVKDLKLQYIAYVLYIPSEELQEQGVTPGIYSMKIGARGWLGMTAEGEACRYGQEAETSFVKARSVCHKQYPRTTHMHMWRVFSSSFTGNENGSNFVDHYPSYEILGEWEDALLDTVEESRELLKQYLLSTYGRRVGFAWRNTTDREFIPKQVCEMLDGANGQEEVAGILMGENRMKDAVKSQLTVGGGKPSAASLAFLEPATPRERPKSSKQAVDEAVDAFGGEAPEPEPKPEPKKAPAPKKKESPLKSLFAGKKPEGAERDPEEAAEAAKKNVVAGTAQRQHTDPNAPGYFPADWRSEEEIEADKGKGIPETTPIGPTSTKGTPVSAIPKGW